MNFPLRAGTRLPIVSLLLLLLSTQQACRLFSRAPEFHPSGDPGAEDKAPPASADAPSASNSAVTPKTTLTTVRAAGPLLDYSATRDQADLDALKKALVFPSISASQVLADFDRTAAMHPRIVANQKDFDRIKSLWASKDEYVLASMNALIKQGESFLSAALVPYQLDAAQLRLTAPHQTQDQIAVLSLLYRLTGDRRYADKVKSHLLHYAAFPDWNDKKHFLDTGIMSYSMALGYDWIYDTLNDAERKTLVQAFIDKSLKAGLARIGENAFWYQSPNNWNPICNGGISLAALAILDSGPEARQLGAQLLEKTLKAIPTYVREFEPDGQSVEGMMYWDYGLSNFIRWDLTMERSLGTDYGYAASPGLSKSGFFPLAVSGPVAGISLGDDPLKKNRSDTNFWFASHSKSSGLARYHRDEIRLLNKYTWLDLLSYDPELLNADAKGLSLPLDAYIRDVDYVSFRSTWQQDQALYVGVHAGDNKASHGHLDAGTFFVQGGGKIWAIGGLGSDNYTFPGYFSHDTLPGYMDPLSPITSPGRFHMYRLRAEGNNTLVFNPDQRPDQNPQGVARIDRILTHDSDAMVTLNLSDIYKRDASSVRRGVALRQDRQAVVIQDEIKANAPSQVYWFMHTMGSLELKQNGRVAVIKQADKTLWVEIQAPSAAQFTIMPASYLPSESFPLSSNSPNNFFGTPIQKLSILLNAVTEQTLTVAMKLVKDGETPTLPGTRPLDAWSQEGSGF